MAGYPTVASGSGWWLDVLDELGRENLRLMPRRPSVPWINAVWKVNGPTCHEPDAAPAGRARTGPRLNGFRFPLEPLAV